MIKSRVITNEWDFSQVHMVSNPIYGMETNTRTPNNMIYKYINIEKGENIMNEQDIEEVREAIEKAMTHFLFEDSSVDTAKAMAKYLAQYLNVIENYDYTLEASLDDNNIVVDLCVNPVTGGEAIYFTGKYNNTPTIGIKTDESNEKYKHAHIAAFDRAMESI